MHWHILMTERCNSQCRYCYEKSIKEFDNGLNKKFEFDFNAPCDYEVDVLKLKKFLKDDKNPVLIFYGGEPLLKIDKIKEIMDNIESEFCIQTNGKLLNKLPKEYINKLSKILISIDGERERTDFNRGEGTYEDVIKNINLIRKNGFSGEIVARMTISQEFPDLFEQVRNILSLNLFDSIHWQIDAGFYKNDFEKNKFEYFSKEYNKNISNLIKWWLSEIKNGKVFRIYPFMGILNRIMKWDNETKIFCGAGHSGYAITTDGKVTACPIMNNIKNFYCGDLNYSVKKLKIIEIVEPCKTCSYSALCGGRCLYSNYVKLWGEEGQELICKTIRHLINEIKKISHDIKEVLDKKIISKKDFEYEKYFGPEIIP